MVCCGAAAIRAPMDARLDIDRPGRFLETFQVHHGVYMAERNPEYDPFLNRFTDAALQCWRTDHCACSRRQRSHQRHKVRGVYTPIVTN